MTETVIQNQAFDCNGYLFEAKVARNEDVNLWIIGYNGFGRSAIDLLQFFFRIGLNAHYSLLAIENPYHGSLNLRNPIHNPLDLIEIREAFNHFKEKNAIKTYYLFGFSMGGKLVAHLLTFNDITPVKSILMAPEGYAKRLFYIYMSRTKAMLYTAKYLLDRPKILLKSIKLLKKIKILRAPLAEFLNVQISDSEKSYLIFNTWTSIRKLQYTFQNIQSHNKLIFIYGDKDPVIRKKDLLKAIEKLHVNSVEKYEIAGKHNLSNTMYTNEIQKVLNKKTLS